ncbi:Acetyl-coenzyme A carboxylase carboxyl transferase subunit alpha [Candidatus Clavichlamydia salmonicola]|uniref:acetyl-CoA carboxylase carboxyltransferase subunit alpha n=1 Tax=Candidatus Clavichlamydia salmonicola TaxID=469812 RepID=UPI001890FCB3|nr:acetyl-CoA carboxylase carboxyltransferase subunit alpha [Candidatus Clavichlamydia salmonicola]MBF5051128.1 Acetyl-coenzyme A carboxylase carboxyl transferase subunit alpha [Candidatus Clavichlamydia salmonicola]
MDLLPHEKQIVEYEKTITQFKEKNKKNSLLSDAELQKLEKRLEKIKKKILTSLSPWERVQVCRHPRRPKTIGYIENICDEFVELCGDRLYSNDTAVIGGLAKIGDMKVMIIGQEKGCDTESRISRNFGMLHPEGFRKALRLAKMAEKFSLPIVFLLDTPGAFPGLSAEERGQGWAIALNLRDLFTVKTPITVIIIGEGCSGGALGMGIGDVVGMLEHAYYSVISPEGCASILWKDTSASSTAASALKMQAEDLLKFGIIDVIIKEPLGGAHYDPAQIYESVKQFILDQWAAFKDMPPKELLEKRYKKFRSIGKQTRNSEET